MIEHEIKANPKRQRILDVASSMFMERGFSAVSMDAIADAAPVSKPTLYSHFKDKKSLFASVMEARCQIIFSEVERQLDKNDDIPDTLKFIADYFLSLIYTDDALALHRIALTETKAFPELGQFFYDFGPKRSISLLANYLEAMHKAKRLVVPNPTLSADFFLSSLKGYTHLQLMLGSKKKINAKQKNEISDYAIQLFLKAHQV